MKALLTLILMINFFLCAAQEQERTMFSPYELTEFVNKPYTFTQKIEESPDWEKNSEDENDSLLIQEYGFHDGSLMLRAITYKENGRNLLVSVVQFVFIEHKELNGRQKLFSSNGWKQFNKDYGTGNKIVSYGYSKGSDILLTAEYTIYYTEAVCPRKYFNRIYEHMR